MNPTLSLCMITYKQDASDLQRCLASVTHIPDLLDEIIIVDTSIEPSSEIKAISDTYGAKLYHRAFNDDFSDVRNFSFDMATSSKILWLDSDDFITEDNLKKLLGLKPKLDEFDVWIMHYNYAHDQNGNPALVLPRERIVKKCPEIRWTEPVHECLTIQESSMIRVDIAIDHKRTHSGSPERNIRILKKQYDKHTLSCRGMFYYAKELFDSGSMEEAVRIFEEYHKEAPGKDFVDNIAISYHKCAQFYGEQSKYHQAKILALRALQYSGNYAETYVLLGDIYQLENNPMAAINYYTQALSKSLGTAGMSQLPQFYHYLPNRALALLYQKMGNTEKAQYHAKAAIAQQSDDLMQQILREIPSPKVAWLFPGRADQSNGSQRIRRINLHMCLSDSKIIEFYLQKPFYELINELEDRNVVIFQHFCLPDLRLIQYLKSQGKRTIMDDCEDISGYPYQTDCMQAVDAVTCCSEVLAQIRASQNVQRVAILPDAWEATAGSPDYSRTGKLKAGFFGMGGNSFLVTSWLRSTIEAAGYELVVCTEWDDATVKWTMETWAQEMYKCDVILCPQRHDIQPAKSNVKVSQAMSMGLPVIASPLHAYKQIIKHGENGYIAEDLKQWGEALEALKDPEVRKRIGEAGKISAEGYSLTRVSGYHQQILRDILAIQDPQGSKIEPQKVQEVVQQSETVDIIIPLYNNWDYLRLCLDSILLNTTPDTPYRIIISDAGSSEETWTHLRALKGIIVLGNPTQRLNFSEACNQGILHSNSKYFVILNSDVIVSKGWLTAMVKKMNSVHRLSSCGVLSNCDSGWTINAPGKPSIDLRVNNQLILHPGMKIEEITPHLDDLNKFMALSNSLRADQFVEQEWVAGYCTMYARSAIEETYLFDPYYNNGCEDLDLEKRLRAMGYKGGQAYDAFVFHFGGVSRYNLQCQDKEQYDKDDHYNHEKYARKWARKHIAIYTGQAWEPWTRFSVEQGMAGSETWAAYIAQEFARLGYEVTIYGHLDHPKAELVLDGVTYKDHRNMLEDLRFVYVDLFISSRTVEPAIQKIHAVKTYVMTHDIWLHPDKNKDMYTWAIQRYYYLSQWHHDFIRSHHASIPEEKLYKTANGIAPYYDDACTYTKKNQSVYSSSPDRGLLQLLEIMPEIRKAVPDFELVICYGFHNWESAAKARNDSASLRMIERIKELMQQPGVVYKGRVSKIELSKLQKESKVWLMPEWFTETFSITAIENRASLNAIVTTALGGLLDTVGEYGILLPPDGLSRDEALPKSYKDKFLEEAIRLLTDEEYRMSWVSKTTPKSLEQYQWSEIAKEFLK